MAQLLHHRGPDDFGFLHVNTQTGESRITQDSRSDFAPNLLLANRRLSVTDLSTAGRQPMANEAGDVFVAFNGAVHNFIELRDELIALGHLFHTETDTEVLLRAYEEWGEDCANRFNGMWAYAIWDQRRHRLVCSRDRFGIKPFYTATLGDTFYFASEAKAILGIEPDTQHPNLAYVGHLINADIPKKRSGTPFAQIEQIPPAHNWTLTEKGRTETEYWRYTDQSENYDYADPENTFRELFYDAVKIRLRGDVPMALLLSGGLDSSSIAVAASKQAPGELRALTARFKGYRYDESEYATAVARQAEIPLAFVDYQADAMVDDIKKVTWHMDSVVTHGQMLVRWHLIQEASKQSTVLFEGQGADEYLGGYPDRHFSSYLKSELKGLRLVGFPGTVGRLFSAATLAPNREIVRDMLRHRLNPFRAETIDVLSSRLRSAQDPDSFGGSWDGELFDDPLHRVLHADHSLDVLPHLLHFGDAISMGHSMESRLPFMDHRLIEFVFSLPFQHIMAGARNKVILREAMGRELPGIVMDRTRKVGFATPDHDWLESNFESQVKPLLRSDRLRDRDIFDPAGLDQMMSRFETHGDYAWRLLRCVCVELWFQQLIDGDGFPR